MCSFQPWRRTPAKQLPDPGEAAVLGTTVPSISTGTEAPSGGSSAVPDGGRSFLGYTSAVAQAVVSSETAVSVAAVSETAGVTSLISLPTGNVLGAVSSGRGPVMATVPAPPPPTMFTYRHCAGRRGTLPASPLLHARSPLAARDPSLPPLVEIPAGTRDAPPRRRLFETSEEVAERETSFVKNSRAIPEGHPAHRAARRKGDPKPQ